MQASETDKREKKKRRGTRGIRRTAPVYDRQQKQAEGEEEQEEPQLQAEGQKQQAEQFREAAREVLTRATASTTARSSEADRRVLDTLGALEKKKTKPSRVVRPQSPEKPEISRRAAQIKLESSLFQQRLSDKVRDLFASRGWGEFQDCATLHLLKTGYFYQSPKQDRLADLALEYLAETGQVRAGGSFVLPIALDEPDIKFPLVPEGFSHFSWRIPVKSRRSGEYQQQFFYAVALFLVL